MVYPGPLFTSTLIVICNVDELSLVYRLMHFIDCMIYISIGENFP